MRMLKKHTSWTGCRYLFKGERPSFSYVLRVFTRKHTTVAAIFLLGNLLKGKINLSSTLFGG